MVAQAKSRESNARNPRQFGIGLNNVDVPLAISCTIRLAAGDVIKLRGNCENFYGVNSFKNASLSLVRLGT